MKCPSLAFLALIAVLVLSAGCASAPQATRPTAPPPTAIPTAAESAIATASPSGALAYADDGPHAVGVRDIAMEGKDYTLAARIWYPALNAEPDTAHGPYPLVVFSMGLAGRARDFDIVLRPMATHGFVVISWDPRGETESDFWAGAATRPMDIQLIINAAEKLAAPGGELAGLIDTRRVAVQGFSSGGWAALIGGGARMDLGWCDAFPDRVAKLPLSNCAQFVPHQQDIAAKLGLDAPPTGLWPPMGDPRVVAVLASSPDGDIWGAEYEGVSSVQVPALIMAGEDDQVNLPEWCAYPIYEHLGSQQKGLVVFKHADHGLGWNMYDDTIKHLQAAFLLAQLKGDAAAAQALLPENMAIPGVTYETTGFSAAR